MSNLKKLIAALALGALSAAQPLQAQTPQAGVTYQGVLKQSGVPVNGSADLRFTLWDAQAGGSPVGVPATRLNVALSQGAFTTTINQANEFGPGAFGAGPRWIQVGVRVPAWNGQGAEPAFVTLSARQEVTPAPLALAVPGIDGHSLNSADGSIADAVMVDNSGRVGVGIQTPNARLEVAGSALGTPFLHPLHLDTYALGAVTRMKFFGSDISAYFSNDSPNEIGQPLYLNGNSSGDVLLARGGGRVGIGLDLPRAPFHVTNTRNTEDGAIFEINNPSNPGCALTAWTNGSGNAICASADNAGTAVHAYTTGTGNAIEGLVGIGNAGNGHAGYFRNYSLTNNTSALFCQSNSAGPALEVIGNAVFSRSLTVSENLDVDGDLYVGPGNLQAVAAPERLQIIHGSVQWDGAILGGTGFSVTRVSGYYDITFTVPFAGQPTVVVTPYSEDTEDASLAELAVRGPGFVQIRTWTEDNYDFFIFPVSFSFIAIGMR